MDEFHAHGGATHSVELGAGETLAPALGVAHSHTRLDHDKVLVPHVELPFQSNAALSFHGRPEFVMASEEVQLLQAWRDGNDSAGEALVERIAGWLLRFFSTKTSSGAADLVQSTLIACVESRDRFDEGRSFRAYVLGIARKQLLMGLRKEARGRKAMALEGQSVALETSVSERLHRQRELRLLLWALRHIDIDLQILVELHYWEEMTSSEIAQVLEIPVGTIKTRLARAKRDLRKIIREARTEDIVIRSTLNNFERWAHSLAAVDLEPSQ